MSGKIFYVMGKSASGKDTIYKELRARHPELGRVCLYTTRPIRDGEKDGQEYFFVNESFLRKTREEKKLIESRTYETVFGPWTYFTADDGQIDLKSGKNYLMIGTLESYERMLAYYGEAVLVPIYIQVEDGLRLERALAREKTQHTPKYREMCRRFLADEEDFCEENLARCKITHRYENVDLSACLDEIEAANFPAAVPAFSPTRL